MQGGKLRHRGIIQNYTQVANNYGEPVKTWATFATRWMDVRQLKGDEQVQAEQLEGLLTHRVRIRKTSGVLPKMRISVLSRILEIDSVVADRTNNRYQFINCKEQIIQST
jgi:SPP1 family predicted phage head-tail adaptor